MNQDFKIQLSYLDLFLSTDMARTICIHFKNFALHWSELFSTLKNMTSLFRVFYAIEQIQNFSQQRALKYGAVFLDTTVCVKFTAQ